MIIVVKYVINIITKVIKYNNVPIVLEHKNMYIIIQYVPYNHVFKHKIKHIIIQMKKEVKYVLHLVNKQKIIR